MPTLRKVSPEEAASWESPAPARKTLPAATRDQLLALFADRTGISRVDTRNTHGWLGRVYPVGQKPLVRSFSDGVYGGPARSLQAAVEWRDVQRAKHPRPKPTAKLWRMPDSRRWLAKRVSGERRYFPDRAYGSTEAAYEAASDWIAEQRTV